MISEKEMKKKLHDKLNQDPAVSQERIHITKMAVITELEHTHRESLPFHEFAAIVIRTCGAGILCVYLGIAFLLILFTKAVFDYEMMEPYALQLYVKISSVLSAGFALLYGRRAKRYRMEETELSSCVDRRRYYFLHLLIPAFGSFIVFLAAVSAVLSEQAGSAAFLILTACASYLSAAMILTVSASIFPAADERKTAIGVCMGLSLFHAFMLSFDTGPLLSGVIALISIILLMAGVWKKIINAREVNRREY